MDEKSAELKTTIMNCLLNKLNKNYDETDYSIEYNLRTKTLENNIPKIRILLGNHDLTQSGESTYEILSLLLTLYYELYSKGPWHTGLSVEYATDLSKDFKNTYDITLDELLSSNAFQCSTIFYMMMDRLHTQLTVKDFKKYPSCIEVYCSLISGLKKFNFEIEVAKVLPISLILIDDYIKVNKSKGLKACKIILSSLSSNQFKDNNYHEVIYKSLLNVLNEKDLEITKLVLDSLKEYIKVMPFNEKENKLDEIFSLVLEEAYMEVNFNRKSLCLACITTMLRIHGVNCVREKKKITQVLSENIEQCAYDSIKVVMCDILLECLEEWVKNCWCAVTFSTDKILICSLIKLLYALNKLETETTEKVLIITSAIIQLFTKDEQAKIIQNIQRYNVHKDDLFSLKLNKLITKINTI